MAGKSGLLFDPEGHATPAELAVTVARLLDPALRTAQDRAARTSPMIRSGTSPPAASPMRPSDGYTYCLVDGW